MYKDILTLDDCIDRTGFLAETTIDTLGHVQVYYTLAVIL